MPLNCEGTWMVEDKPVKKQLVLIARAIVVPQNGLVPLRIINLDYRIEGNFGGVKLWRNATRNPFGEINFGEFTDHTRWILIALNFRIRDPYYARVQPVAH